MAHQRTKRVFQKDRVNIFLDKSLFDLVEDYCEHNNISDIDEFIHMVVLQYIEAND